MTTLVRVNQSNIAFAMIQTPVIKAIAAVSPLSFFSSNKVFETVVSDRYASCTEVMNNYVYLDIITQ